MHKKQTHTWSTPLHNAKTLVLDILFPPSPEERIVRTTRLEDVAERITLQKVFPHIHALFSYKDSLIHILIQELKYHGSKRSAGLLGICLKDILTEDIAESNLFSSTKRVVIIPIPLSKQRRKERGWNQVEILLKETLEQVLEHMEDSDISYLPRALKRVRHTKSQTDTKSKRERLENVRGVFEVNPKYKDQIIGSHTILVDDVTTTGATLREARKVLLESGAKKVECFALAH